MTIWLQGENGAVMSFSEPLPPVIEAQRARGILRPADAPAMTVPVVPDDSEFREKLAAELEAARVSLGQDSPEAPERPAEPADQRPQRIPSVRASAGTWRAYAISQGMPRGKASAMTKSALISEFTRLRSVS